MYQTLTVKGLLEVMKHIQGERTQLEFAQELNVSPQYLSDVYNMRRDPGPRILSSLGATTAFVVPDSIITSTATRSQKGLHAEEGQKGRKSIKKQR